MRPAARLNSLLASLTVIAMFFLITQVAPRLSALAVKWQYLSAVAAMLTSASVYRLLSVGIRWLLDRSPRVKKLIFGAEFVHGTWIG